MDKLHKKSVAALFVILASGVVLFFYSEREKSETLNEEPPKDNLAAAAEQVKIVAPKEEKPQSQVPAPDLSGFDDLSKEAEELNELLIELD